MGLQRFYPIKDTWITSKAVNGPYGRASGSNLGSNPTLQAFKITSSFPSADVELARSLLMFDGAQMQAMIQNQTMPATGVSFVLKAFDYQVHDTTPSSYDLEVCAISGGWDEGIGQDDKQFYDKGFANWEYATSTRQWTYDGGDYYTANSGSQHFDFGTEDLEIDVTNIVTSWLTGTIAPNGLMIKFTDACELNQNDYYRKVFYSRETHIVEKIPFLEARWNDVRKDNRGNFAYNAPNALFLYNFVRGSLVNVPNLPISVRLQDHLSGSSASFVQTYASASLQETGVYAMPLNVQSAAPNFSASWYDIWTDATGKCLMTGSFRPLNVTGSQVDQYDDFVVNPVGLKRVYRTDERAHINVNVRRRNYNNQLVVHTASFMSDKDYMEDMYFSVLNNETGDTVIPFGTGSVPYTKLSYNLDGNYFQLGMDSFVPGFAYRMIFMIYYNKYEKLIVDEQFVFKVI